MTRTVFKTELIADYRFLIPFFLSIVVAAVLLTNLVLSRALHVHQLLISMFQYSIPFSFDLLLKELFFFQMKEYPWVYILGIGLGIGIGIKMCYKLRSSFKNLANGQKGTSRFTTLEELKRDYKSVPEKIVRFEGGGGVPISRYKDTLFIDNSAVNNLWIGTTRSGKGEIGMFSLIDVYSRATDQASLILNDPKGELYAASKETLEKRGYHVDVLNLSKPMESMSYQILQLVIDNYKQGNYSAAQQYANSVSHMLYYNPTAKDPFWQDCSISLCNALILGICDKCINENKEEQITMYSVANMLSTLGSKTVIDEEVGIERNALDLYFSELPDNSAAKMQYAASNFSSGTSRGGIFTNTFSKLSIFTLDNIAKMTSKSSFDLKKVGFGQTVIGFTTPLTRINMTFPNGQVDSIRSDVNGRFELNYTKHLNEGDMILFKETKNDYQLKVKINKIKENGEVEFDIQGEENIICIKKFECYKKPIAVFMITPDYEASLHVIASLFVIQLYKVLSENASNTKGDKCLREVVFILDEFGNMPAIPNMDTVLTVCLGRNIRFNLAIQSYSQLKTKYGDAWETIDGGCNNTIYILTTDETTAERISKKLGERTITTISRSGGSLSLNKNKTESVDSRRLLNSTELMQLKEGEMIVVRTVKRQDLMKKKITPYPIFNTVDTAMKYRWEYLGEFFNTSNSINDIDISCLHADVELNKLIIDFSSNTVDDNPVEKETTQTGNANAVRDCSFEQAEKRLTDFECKDLLNVGFHSSQNLIEDVLAPGMIKKIDLCIRACLDLLEGEQKEKYLAVYEEIEGMDELETFLQQKYLEEAYEEVKYLFPSKETLPM